MAAPALRAIPAVLASSAASSHATFTSKIETDADFRSFVHERDAKITRLYDAISTAIGSFEENMPIARKLFNGPVTILVKGIDEAGALKLGVSGTEEAPFEQRSNTDEGEARACIRDWQVRAVAMTELFMLTAPRDRVSEILDAPGFKMQFITIKSDESPKLFFAGHS